MNRREFHKLSALAAAFSFAPLTLAEDFDYPWKLGIITDEVDPDLNHVLDSFYPKYQLRWAEIRNVALSGKSSYVYRTASPQQLHEMKKQLADKGVKLSILDTAVYKNTLPGTQPVGEKTTDEAAVKAEHARQLEELKRAAEAVHALGTDRLRIFTFKRVSDPNSIFPRIVEEVGKALAVAKAQDVTLLVENEFSCNTATGAESRQLFDAISDRRLMHNWDPGNCVLAGEQPFPKAWDEIDHSRIAHIHIKDARGKTWRPVGGGDIDFTGQFRALKQMRYAGTLSLETHYRNAQHDIYASSVESMNGLFKVLQSV